MRAAVELLVVLAAFALLVIFLRAFANLRSGSRIEKRTRALRENADLELERLQAEMAAARRTAGEDAASGKE
jgi:hypothetical protein